MAKGDTTTSTKIDPRLEGYRNNYLNSVFGYAAGAPLRQYGVPGQYDLPRGGIGNSPDVPGHPGTLDPGAMGRAAGAWRNAQGQPVPAGTPGAQPDTGGSGGSNLGLPSFAPGQDPWVAGLGDPTADINTFMNPYEGQVIGGLRSDFDRQRILNQNRVADLATKEHAFGGSRHGVVESMGAADIGRNEGNTVGNFRYAGYNDALGRSVQERNAKTAQRQAEIDAAKARFDERQNYGLKNLGLLGNAVGGFPYGNTSTTHTAPDPWKDFLGTAATIGSFAL